MAGSEVYHFGINLRPGFFGSLQNKNILNYYKYTNKSGRKSIFAFLPESFFPRILWLSSTGRKSSKTVIGKFDSGMVFYFYRVGIAFPFLKK